MTISHKKAFKYLQNYLDNKISPKTDLLLKEHLETCESCKNIFDLQKTLAVSNPWKNEGSSPARINQTIEIVQKDQRSFLMFSKLSKSVKFLSIATIAVALIALVSVSINNLLPSPGNEPASIGSNEIPTDDSTAIPEQQVLTEDSEVEFSELNSVGGYLRALDIENNLMLVGISQKIMLLDIQDPNKPITLTSFRLESWISAVAIKLPHAYIALGDGTIVLLDISNSNSPSIRGMVGNFYDLSDGYFSKILISTSDDNNNAYFIWTPFLEPHQEEVIPDHVKIMIFDPQDLYGMIHHEVPYYGFTSLDFNISGKNLIISRGCSSDLPCSQTNETELIKLPDFNSEDTVTFPAGVKGSPGKTAIFNDLLISSWVECNEDDCNTHFMIHDINKPDQSPIFQLELNDIIRGLAINDGIAVLSYADGLHRIDLNASKNIVDLGFKSEQVFTSGELEYSSDFLYLKSETDGVSIYDYSPFNTPVLINSLFEGSIFADVEVIVDIVFSLPSSKKLQVLDFSDPADPGELGEINDGEGRLLADLFVNDQTAYIASRQCLTISVIGYCTGTLEIFDVPNLKIPKGIKQLSVERYINTPWKVVAPDSLAYMVDGETLWIIDISDSTNLPEPEIFNIGGVNPSSISFIGENQLLLGGENGMRVYDISSPINPELLKEAGRGPIDIVAIFQSKGVAYLSGQFTSYPPGEQQTNLLNLNSYEITSVSFGKEVGKVNALASYKEFLLVVDDSYLFVFEIDDPANPVLINQYPIDIATKDMAIHGQYVYLRGNAGSLTILEIDE